MSGRTTVDEALFAARYPVAAHVLLELANDASVTPAVYERVCAAVFDVADRHVDNEPGPPRGEWRTP